MEEKTIGERLKERLDQEGVKPSKFATDKGLPIASLYKWLGGTRPNNPEHYQKIVDYLDGKLENVPVVSGTQRNPGHVDYQAKYIALLEKREAEISLNAIAEKIAITHLVLESMYTQLVKDSAQDKSLIEKLRKSMKVGIEAF